jgi:heterodisulfide reductase subunit A-like polyferredoxin
MAVARVSALEPLHKQPVALEPAALVIGGGPAGMTAALTLADQGFPVHLVEREKALGGNLRRLHFALPQANGAETPDLQAGLADLRARIARSPMITTHLETEVAEVRGSVGNFASRLAGRQGETEVHHAVIVVATGGQEYRGPEYGYGTDPRLLTQLEFEERLASELSLEQVNRVVMIQCVGPAEQTCARTCCATALKNALRLKALRPGAQVVVLYRDMRTYGFKERLYTRAREQGVLFLRYDEDHRPQVDATSTDRPIRVDALDPSLGLPVAFEADLVVLSMPMVPAPGSRALGTVLKVPVDQDGWFLEAHVKLRPVEFASRGIYLAGAAHYPKLLDEAIVQGQAAASRAATILSQPNLSAGGMVAQVDTKACVGCLTCVRVCPLGVPAVRDDQEGVGGVVGAAYIEPTLCQGCGTCVGECPAGAIELLHYRHEQVEKQIEALFAAAESEARVNR